MKTSVGLNLGLNTSFFFQFFQAGSKSRTRFDFDSVSPEDGIDYHLGLGMGHHPGDPESGKRRPNYMPTRGLAAVLNQGLATLGEKLGKSKVFYCFNFKENYIFLIKLYLCKISPVKISRCNLNTVM